MLEFKLFALVKALFVFVAVLFEFSDAKPNPVGGAFTLAAN